MSYMFCIPCRWVPIVVAVANATRQAADEWCWENLQVDCVPQLRKVNLMSYYMCIPCRLIDRLCGGDLENCVQLT